jgi:hypothetical protein
MMLAAAFLLGMAVNLIGLPNEAEGSAKITTTAFLGLHVLVAIGLVAGTINIMRIAKRLDVRMRRLTYAAAACIGVTFAAGVITMITTSNWWSYAMAMGFVVAFMLYGVVFTRTKA